MDELRARFRPATPAVYLTYDLAYRLLGVVLFRLGEARIETATGQFDDGNGGRTICLFDCRIQPPAAADARAVLRDRFLLITEPRGQTTLVFAQMTDESFRPLIGRVRRRLHFEVYDFLAVPPVNFRTNLITGVSTNRPADRPGHGRPGQEVMTLLNVLGDVHEGGLPMLDPSTSPRLYARVDGEARPFAIRTVPDEPPGRYPRTGMKALRADVAAAPEAKTHRGGVTAWTMPYAEVVELAGFPNLVATNAPLPLRAMPMALDCELSVGTVRATLKAIAPADAAPPASADGMTK